MGTLINYYELLPKKKATGPPYPNYNKIRIDLPTRAAIVGPSGAGKTNIALNFILGIGAFARIYLVVKSPEEPLYQLLVQAYEKVGEKVGKELITVLTDPDDLPTVDEFDDKIQNLVLFDDVITEKISKLKKIGDFWIRGRKWKITTLFLSQSYFAIPNIIRKNTTLLILRGIAGKRDLNTIMSEFAVDKTHPELMAMYNQCNPQGAGITDFLAIDLEVGQDPRYKYRKGWAPIDG